MSSFSIIVCTHNPDPVIFSRLLNALASLERITADFEIILVDNNSTAAIAASPVVKNFVAGKNYVTILEERKPGLTAARTAGIRSAKYEWIVFFDDDNEPAADYLTEAENIIKQHSSVGAWGPGNLQVVYYPASDSAWLNKIKWLFQQRDYNRVYVDNNTIEGSEYYPFGTGMVVRKNILEDYLKKIETGKFTMSDRKGKDLTSAGDLQILFTCLQGGYFAGSTPSLRLNHNISKTKTTLLHVCRLVYALNSSQLKAYNEVFPERIIHYQTPVNKDVLNTLSAALRTYRANRDKYGLLMFISKKMGELNARVVAANVKKPVLLSLFEKLIGI